MYVSPFLKFSLPFTFSGQPMPVKKIFIHKRDTLLNISVPLGSCMNPDSQMGITTNNKVKLKSSNAQIAQMRPKIFFRKFIK
jgi:hypothetical protein